MTQSRPLLCFAAAFGIVCAATAHADYDAGMEAYQIGDYETALNEWVPLANAGNPDALYALAVMFHDGLVVGSNYAIAERYYLLALEHGKFSAESGTINLDNFPERFTMPDSGSIAAWSRESQQGSVNGRIQVAEPTKTVSDLRGLAYTLFWKMLWVYLDVDDPQQPSD